MPNFSSPQSSRLVKAMLLGDSKAGKTGALMSLILAGYNLRVLDFDNNIGILINLMHNAVAERKLTLEQANTRLRYVTPMDKYKQVAGQAVVDGIPRAWSTAMSTLTEWKEGKAGEPEFFQLPKLEQWTDQDVLVIDTLWSAGKSCLNHIMAMNGKLNQKPRPADLGDTQRQLDSFMQLLKSGAVNCHVLVLSHIVVVESTIGGKKAYDEDGSNSTPLVQYDDPHGYAAFGAGKALAKDLPKYMGNVFLVKTSGAGVREIHTRSQSSFIELGSANPDKVPAKLPLATGLAEIFKALRGV